MDPSQVGRMWPGSLGRRGRLLELLQCLDCKEDSDGLE
jgi:hypothetical protein